MDIQEEKSRTRSSHVNFTGQGWPWTFVGSLKTVTDVVGTKHGDLEGKDS